MNDYDRVRNILQGQKEYFVEAIQLIRDPLFLILCGSGMDEEEAENTVIECIAAIYGELPGYKEHDIFSEWMMEKGLAKIYSSKLEELNRKSPLGDIAYPILFVYIAYDLLRIKKELLIKALQITEIKLEAMLMEGRKVLYAEVESIEGNSCLALNELFKHVKGSKSSNGINKEEEHLEFCRDCRERLFHINTIKASQTQRLHSFWLEDDFATKVMDRLEPYKVKKRSWRYQVLSVVSVIAIFSIAILIVPNVSKWSEYTTNYIKYGAFYNVWGEGEFAVTDKDITFEVTSVEVGEVYMILHYKVDGNRVDNFIEAGFASSSTLLDMWNHNSFKVRLNEKEYNLAKANANPDFFQKNGKIVLTSPIYEAAEEDIELLISLKQIAGAYGEWELSIPLKIPSEKSEVEHVEIDQQYEFENKVQLSIKDIVRTKEGSMLNYQVSLTEAERERIREMVSKNRGRFINQNIDLHASAIINLVNEHDEKLFPVHFNGLVQDPNMERIDFLSYIFNPDTQELNEDKVDRQEALWLEVEGFHYIDADDFKFSLPTALGEDIPIDLEYKGDTFYSLTVREVDTIDALFARPGLEFTIRGKRNNPLFQRSYYFASAGNEHLNIFHREQYVDEEDGILISFQIEKTETVPKLLHLERVPSHIVMLLEERLKIPLQ